MGNTNKEDVIRGEKFEENSRKLVIGAAQDLEDVYSYPETPEIVKFALSHSTSWQERNEYSVEKSLLSASLIAEWTAVLLSLNADVIYEDGEEASLNEFYAQKAVKGKIKSLVVPIEVPGRMYGEAHVGMTSTDKPIVSAFATVDLKDGVVEDAHVALTGAWQGQARLAETSKDMVGKSFDEELISEIGSAVSKEVEPKGNYRGSEEYRRKMAGVMVKRALEECKKGA